LLNTEDIINIDKYIKKIHFALSGNKNLWNLLLSFM